MMTVAVFKQFITSLFGQKHYTKEKLFYMKVYAAAQKNNEMNKLAENLKDIQKIMSYSKISIKHPPSFFNHFIDKSKS